MLTIREEQMESFEADALRRFAERAVAYMQGAVPTHYKILGREKVHGVVEEGLTRAAKYGLTTENSLLFYVQTMFILGSFFDADPQLPWARAVLTDPAIPDEGRRIYALNERLAVYSKAVVGREEFHLIGALRAVRTVPPAELAALAIREPDRFVEGQLRRIYPQKFEFLGEEGVRRLVARARESAAGYGIGGEAGITVYAGLMFLLGSSFDTDPQFGWAAAVLQDRTIKDQDQKTERLYRAAMDYLDLWTR